MGPVRKGPMRMTGTDRLRSDFWGHGSTLLTGRSRLRWGKTPQCRWSLAQVLSKRHSAKLRNVGLRKASFRLVLRSFGISRAAPVSKRLARAILAEAREVDGRQGDA